MGRTIVCTRFKEMGKMVIMPSTITQGFSEMQLKLKACVSIIKRINYTFCWRFQTFFYKIGWQRKPCHQHPGDVQFTSSPVVSDFNSSLETDGSDFGCKIGKNGEESVVFGSVLDRLICCASEICDGSRSLYQVLWVTPRILRVLVIGGTFLRSWIRLILVSRACKRFVYGRLDQCYWTLHSSPRMCAACLFRQWH